MKFETGPMQVELTEDGVRCYAETQVTFDDETPEEQLLVYERYRQVVSEELTRHLRSHGIEEVEQLFDKYIEEKKNVESSGHELDRRGSKDVERKSEVIHEVQD